MHLSYTYTSTNLIYEWEPDPKSTENHFQPVNSTSEKQQTLASLQKSEVTFTDDLRPRVCKGVSATTSLQEIIVSMQNYLQFHTELLYKINTFASLHKSWKIQKAQHLSKA